MELIAVSQTIIGQSAVNAVNTRDLHSRLEVKTKYADWIKRAIDKYGFEEGIDFTILKNGNGNNAFIDYIVSLDMAKELCMLDDSDKGRQFRKYFIECEKQAQIPRTPSEQIHLLAQGYTQIEQVVNEVKADVENLKNDIVLTSAQKRAIQNAVSLKVYSFDVLADKKKTSALFKRVYKTLKDHFAVSSYMEIRRIDYDEAKNFIDRLTLMDLVVGVEK